MEVCSCQGTRWSGSAAEFIVQTVRDHPGEVSILALGPLTNIAIAMQLDSSTAEKAVCPVVTFSIRLCASPCFGNKAEEGLDFDVMQAEIVVLGGAFFVNGNVNPAGNPPSDNISYCCL